MSTCGVMQARNSCCVLAPACDIVVCTSPWHMTVPLLLYVIGRQLQAAAEGAPVDDNFMLRMYVSFLLLKDIAKIRKVDVVI